MYDLVVIGGGPAGCAATITARRSGRSVLLLEQGCFPRHKVCGEFVSGEATSLLQTLFLPADHARVRQAPRIAGARIYVFDCEIGTPIDPPAISMRRLELDSALWRSAIQAGADVRENCAVRAVGARPVDSRSEPGTGFRVVTDDQCFEAKALINASGRWSFLTSRAARESAKKKASIGLKAHFLEPSQSTTSVDLYFFDGGYCGVQPVFSQQQRGSGTVINVCAMVRPEMARNLSQVFLCHPRLAQRSQSWETVIDEVRTAPLLFQAPEPVRGNLLQVGDAATFVDPFIGDGISLALRSGELAVGCLEGFFSAKTSLDEAAENYSTLYHERLTPIFRASSRLRRMLDLPSLVRLPALFLLARMPQITARLVKMTR
jgi:flavin-dependent dehydrogenase